MTKDEENQIEKLYARGIGYRTIAKELNLSTNTIKSYIARKRKKKVTYCLNCGKELKVIPKIKKRKYCSIECKKEFYKEHPDFNLKLKENRVCPKCGSTFFEYKSINRKYCSHHCYVIYRFSKEEGNDE